MEKDKKGISAASSTSMASTPSSHLSSPSSSLDSLPSTATAPPPPTTKSKRTKAAAVKSKKAVKPVAQDQAPDKAKGKKTNVKAKSSSYNSNAAFTPTLASTKKNVVKTKRTNEN